MDLTESYLHLQQEQMCVYDMSDVEKEAGYSREDLVAMALLVGSDYGGGVKNVAWEKAKDLRRALDGSNLLERWVGWTGDTVKYSYNVVQYGMILPTSQQITVKPLI